MKTEQTLIDVQPLIDIISLTLQTAYIKDNVDGYRPSSLLLIAKPESAKTKTIEIFNTLPFVYFTNEITVQPLVNQVFPDIERGIIRFIMIPDILNCIRKQTYTREPLLQTLKSLVDEGVKHILTPYKRYDFKSPIKAGLITAITGTALYEKGGRYSLYEDLKRYGFLSRLIPFSYEYPIDKVVKIFEYIMSGDMKDVFSISVPKIKQFNKEKSFQPNQELFSNLQLISHKLGSYMDAYGIRVQKNLQKLCYAHAVLNERDHVTKEDIDKVLYLGKWMNFDFNPL